MSFGPVLSSSLGTEVMHSEQLPTWPMAEDSESGRACQNRDTAESVPLPTCLFIAGPEPVLPPPATPSDCWGKEEGTNQTLLILSRSSSSRMGGCKRGSGGLEQKGRVHLVFRASQSGGFFSHETPRASGSTRLEAVSPGGRQGERDADASPWQIRLFLQRGP